MEEMQAIEFVRKYRIDGEIIHGPNTANVDGWEHYAMTIRLGLKTPTGETRYIDIPFKVGVGWDVPAFTGSDDTLPDESVATVIGNIAGSVRDRDRDCEDFLSDFVADIEDLTVREHRKHESMWRAVVKQGRDIVDWLYSQAQVDDIETVVD